MRAQPILDAHVHFWDLERNYLPWLQDEPPWPFRYGDYRDLRRTYLPADYARDVAGFEVVGTIYVEAQWDPTDPLGETRWVHQLASASGQPSAMVAQAHLHAPDVAEVLAAQAAFPLVRGVRHKPRAAPGPANVELGAPGSMGDPAWRRGFSLLAAHGLSFDLQTDWWHLDEAFELATAFPETTIVLDHTGLPADRSEAGLEGWRQAMARLARAPNVWVKISGLGVPGQPWTVAANGWIVRTTLELFGTDRCLFASNYPVDRLVGSFAAIYDGFLAVTEDLDAAERQCLFADNARRVYRLGERR